MPTKLPFQLLKPEKGIYHIVYPNQRDLAHSMMRLQEYYEGASDDVRGHYLSLEEFLHHFTDEDGKFEYTSIWSGFNVPGHIVEQWWGEVRAHGELTEREKKLKRLLQTNLRRDKPHRWYLIATAGDINSDTVLHEVAHGLFYLNETYRASCTKLIDSIPKSNRKRIGKALIDMGYTEIVVPDEIQAYLGTSDIDYLRDKIDLTDDEVPFVELFKNNLFEILGKEAVYTDVPPDHPVP
jgi:hypothetical protein